MTSFSRPEAIKNAHFMKDCFSNTLNTTCCKGFGLGIRSSFPRITQGPSRKLDPSQASVSFPHSTLHSPHTHLRRPSLTHHHTKNATTRDRPSVAHTHTPRPTLRPQSVIFRSLGNSPSHNLNESSRDTGSNKNGKPQFYRSTRCIAE